MADELELDRIIEMYGNLRERMGTCSNSLDRKETAQNADTAYRLLGKIIKDMDPYYKLSPFLATRHDTDVIKLMVADVIPDVRDFFESLKKQSGAGAWTAMHQDSMLSIMEAGLIVIEARNKSLSLLIAGKSGESLDE